LPGLQQLSLKFCPLSKFKHFKEMAVMSFGPSLKIVNQQMVSRTVLETAQNCRSDFVSYLQEDYIITNLSAKEVWRPGDDDVVHLDLPLSEAQQLMTEIESNDRVIQELLQEKRRLLTEKRARDRNTRLNWDQSPRPAREQSRTQTIAKEMQPVANETETITKEIEEDSKSSEHANELKIESEVEEEKLEVKIEENGGGVDQRWEDEKLNEQVQEGAPEDRPHDLDLN
jgi:hypothetical protein